MCHILYLQHILLSFKHDLDNRWEEKNILSIQQSPYHMWKVASHPQTLHVKIISLLQIARLFLEPWTFLITFILCVNHTLSMQSFLNISFSLAKGIFLFWKTKSSFSLEVEQWPLPMQIYDLGTWLQ
jgi:hypothetical protein